MRRRCWELGCGKFTIDIPAIVHWIREGFDSEALPLPGTLTLKRLCNTGETFGYDKEGVATTFMTIITTTGGLIKTAFSGGCGNGNEAIMLK